MLECENFLCGCCQIVQSPEMFGESPPPDADGIVWAGPIEGNEEAMACMKKKICKEYKPMAEVGAEIKMC